MHSLNIFAYHNPPRELCEQHIVTIHVVMMPDLGVCIEVKGILGVDFTLAHVTRPVMLELSCDLVMQSLPVIETGRNPLYIVIYI